MKVRIISGLNEADYNRQFPSNPYALGAIGRVNPVNRVLLVTARGAFLSLVSLNILGLATALKRKHDTDRGALQSKWENLGGTYDKLQQAFNKGASKRPILKKLGSRVGIGVDPATTSVAVTWIVNAGIIITALLPIIKQFIPPANEFDDSVTVEDVDNIETKSTTNLIITAGLIAGGLFFLSQNMRKR